MKPENIKIKVHQKYDINSTKIRVDWTKKNTELAL